MKVIPYLNVPFPLGETDRLVSALGRGLQVIQLGFPANVMILDKKPHRGGLRGQCGQLFLTIKGCFRTIRFAHVGIFLTGPRQESRCLVRVFLCSMIKQEHLDACSIIRV